MTPAQREFERLGPWMSRFVIDGVALGGEYDYRQDVRLGHVNRRFGSLGGRRVLELGALEGGHTLELARAGASVVAVEGRAENLARCRFIKRHFGLDTVEFVPGDLRTVDLAALGPFDLILASGVLYHLDAPWDLLARLAPVAPTIFLWTHCAPGDAQIETVEVRGRRLDGCWYAEGAANHPLSGMQPRSFWPTRESLEVMLEVAGWGRLTWLDYDPGWTRGPAATLWADRTLQ